MIQPSTLIDGLGFLLEFTAEKAEPDCTREFRIAAISQAQVLSDRLGFFDYLVTLKDSDCVKSALSI